MTVRGESHRFNMRYDATVGMFPFETVARFEETLTHLPT